MTNDKQQKYLSFNLGEKDTAVISLQKITEVIQVSLPEICSVPQMPSCVLGIYNWRGEMLWLADLEEMLGYAPVSHSSYFLNRMMTIVLQTETKSLGLLVRQILDVEWLDNKKMKIPESQIFSSELENFIEGYFIHQSEKMIINLNTTAILQAPIWGINRELVTGNSM